MSPVAKLESLLNKGTDVNTTLGSLDSTVLYEASFRGYSRMVEMILDHGADVNARTNQGVTSLYVAAQNGHLETVRIVHGKGTGALRAALHARLEDHPLVRSYRLADPADGDVGATVVELGERP